MEINKNEQEEASLIFSKYKWRELGKIIRSQYQAFRWEVDSRKTVGVSPAKLDLMVRSKRDVKLGMIENSTST